MHWQGGAGLCLSFKKEVMRIVVQIHPVFVRIGRAKGTDGTEFHILLKTLDLVLLLEY